MNSKKLWTSFILIVIYLLLTAFVASGSANLFVTIGWKWGVPFAVGCIFWVLSLVLFLCREKAFLFSPFSLLSNAVGAGFFIGAYIIGKKLAFSWIALTALSFSVSLTYLVLMLFLSVPVIKRKIWYVIIAFALCVTASVFLSQFLFSKGAGMHLPQKSGMFFFFFLFLYGMLALGSLAPVDNFEELLTFILIPSLVSTFFIAIIVLFCLAGDGDCDCGDGCEGCCDCGDCSGGEYNSTTYGKRRSTTMSQMSNTPPIV